VIPCLDRDTVEVRFQIASGNCLSEILWGCPLGHTEDNFGSGFGIEHNPHFGFAEFVPLVFESVSDVGMYLNGQRFAGIEDFNQERELATFERPPVIRAYEVTPQLREQIGEWLTGIRAITDECGAVVMPGDLPAFGNDSIRDVTAQFFKVSPTPGVIFKHR
jgi:hypothetical protein